MESSFDFGISGKRALICGSSQGLGYACAEAPLRGGADIVLNGRSEARLAASVKAMEAIAQRPVKSVVADIATEEGRRMILEACPRVDILVNNAGGPPPGDIGDWDETAWLAALRVNMVAPIQLIRAILPGMRARQWGRIINITSMAVKMPLPRLGLSNGTRAGLTGFIAGLAREVASDGVTINNLLPGRFATSRLKSYLADVAGANGRSYDAVVEEIEAGIPVRRIGRPEEFGAFCLFIASEQAGYMTGQSILLNGGEYPGTF
mgnify:FL=1